MDQLNRTEPDGRPDGERRQVTVLFADVVDFTPLAERLGEEASFRLMQEISAELMVAVHRHQGTIQEFTGDGVMALFGAPDAMEDGPLRACRASLDIQARMLALEDKLEAAHGARPKVRIGMHSGPLVIGTVGDDKGARLTAIGDTANFAARLESAAETGAIYISAALQALVDGQVESIFVGKRTLKGKSGLHSIYRLDGIRSGVSRFDAARNRGLTSLVERESELEVLRRCWDQVLVDGIHVAQIVGDAGIGKSRLLHEFRQRLPDEDLFILKGDCHEAGAASAFLPFIEVVRTSFRISADDEEEVVDQKLESGLKLLGLAVDDALPYLMTLLGQCTSDPTIARQGADVIGVRTRRALLDLVWQRCRMTPVVLFVEDLHWIDSASEGLLQQIVTASENLALLVVCAYRPHYRPPWSGSENITEIAVGPLTRDGTVRLLSNRLGTTELPDELVRVVVAKAEGNPLFAEEIANYLQERREDQGPITALHGDTVLPANLQNLLMARFDRLNDGHRSVLQVAAVLGRKFSSSLVQRVARLDGGVDECLAELERQELVFPIREPDADFVFKHVLVRDAIYSTLMTSQQNGLHADVGDAMEQAYDGRWEEVADALAHHFERTDRRDKAIHYLTMAGRKSLKVFSLNEADRKLARAIELIEVDANTLDMELWAEVLSSWLHVQFWLADFRRIVEIVEMRFQILEQLGNSRYSGLIGSYLGWAYVCMNQFDEAKQYLPRALSIAESFADDEAISQVCFAYMNMYNFCSGEMPAGYVARLGRRAFNIADNNENMYTWTMASFNLGWHATVLGNFDECKRLGLRSIEFGRQKNYPGAIGFGFLMIAYANLFSERFDEAIRNAEEGVQSAAGALDRLVSLGMKGSAMVLAGQSQEGLSLLLEVRRQMQERGLLLLLNLVEVPIGVAMVLNGDMTTGVRWIEDTSRQMFDWGNMHAAAIGHIALGEIYLEIAMGKRKPPLAVLLRNIPFLVATIPFAKSKAVRHFEKALQFGREAGMNGIVAQALMDLGLVHKARNRLPEAKRYLEEARDVATILDWQFINDKIASELITIR